MTLRRRGVNNKNRLLVFLCGFIVFVACAFMAHFNFTNATDLAELDPDDWNLELVFFDETVNNGKDPITNVNWNIASSEPLETFSRSIKMQVNYRNEDVKRTYAPGELQIVVPNPFSKANSTAAFITNDTIVGANKVSQDEYDWDYNYNNYYEDGTFIFTNHTPIEITANIEGSIQVSFLPRFDMETTIERFDDNCVHEVHETNMKAIMNGVVESNTANLHASRTINHPWSKVNYSIKKTAMKLNSYDNLGDNASDYTWVHYRFGGKSSDNNNLGYDTEVYSNYIGLSNYEMRDKFPTDVKITNMSGGTIPQDEDGYVDVKQYGTSISNTSPCSGYRYICRDILVGYPKSIYNANNNNTHITNTVELYGTYANENEEKQLATSTIELDLPSFDIAVSGDIVGIKKKLSQNVTSNYNYFSDYQYYYQDIIRNGSTGRWDINISTKNIGKKYDLQIGDDLLYHYDSENGSLNRMNEDYYSFTELYLMDFRNTSNVAVPSNKYKPDLYVRYKGETEYVKYASLAGTKTTVNFSNGAPKPVVGWYLDIKGLTEGIKDFEMRPYIQLKSKTIAEKGILYNFAYVKYFVDGALINPSSAPNYGDDITRNAVGAYDLDEHDAYLQRAFSKAEWGPHEIGKTAQRVGLTKNNDSLGSPEYFPSEEAFKDQYILTGHYSEYIDDKFKDVDLNLEQLKESDWHKSVTYYDLLPFGVDLDDTPEGIASKTGIAKCYNSYLIGKDGDKLFNSAADCRQFVQSHTTVKIDDNWRNTGRTYLKIKIDFSEKPFINMYGSDHLFDAPSVQFNYKITYDSYSELGNTFTNHAYFEIDNYHTTDGNYPDDGRYDSQASDINENNSTEDRLAHSSNTVTLRTATSSAQDIQTSVLTNHSGKYETDEVQSGFSEDYSYKLRVRTGASRVTNLVLYEHIEEMHGDNKFWQGSFDGVDTSFAESKLDYYDKPIKVKVYYSTKRDAGSLSSDSSWQEYDPNTTDKTQVRSLAFQYLDQNGQPAVLLQSSYTYVLVHMKAPGDEDIKTLAYNNSHSEWNAIDNLTGELIYNITGIESNTVTVFLTEKYDLHVKKEWSDYDNHYELRPESIKFNLLKDGEIVDSRELNVANGENEVVFEKLNTLDQDHYTIEEEAVENYTASSVQDSKTLNYTFTNTVDRDEPKPDSEQDPKPEPRSTPSSEDLPKNAQTNDNGIKIFFIAGGAMAGLIVAAGITIRRTMKKA